MSTTGNPLWLLPIGEAAQWLADSATKVDPAQATALSVIFNARVMLEIAESQKAMTEALVTAGLTTAGETRRLVTATIRLAIVTAVVGLGAIAAAIITTVGLRCP
jgi:hypothetical protein